jgi:hypothetical protein
MSKVLMRLLNIVLSPAVYELNAVTPKPLHIIENGCTRIGGVSDRSVGITCSAFEAFSLFIDLNAG